MIQPGKSCYLAKGEWAKEARSLVTFWDGEGCIHANGSSTRDTQRV